MRDATTAAQSGNTFPESKRKILDLMHPSSDGWTTWIGEDGSYEAKRHDPDTGCLIRMAVKPRPLNGRYPWYVGMSGTPEQVARRQDLDMERPGWRKRLGRLMGLTS